MTTKAGLAAVSVPVGQEPLRAILEQRSMLLGYAYAIVRDLHMAEDILQEALILATREQFQSADHARGWIRVTVRNLAMNELRRRARHPVGISDETMALLEPEWQAAADEPYHHGERLAALRACCDALSEPVRQLLDLRFREGLDGAAIAARLGRPLNTIHVGLSRSYRRLADCISARLSGAL